MSKLHKVRYRVVKLEIDDEYFTRWHPSIHPIWAVEACAKHFQESERTEGWPFTFALLNEDGSEFGRYTVEEEIEITYSAVKKDEPERKAK